MKGWVGLVGWPIAGSLPTKWSPVQLLVRRRSRKVRRPKTGVLPCTVLRRQPCFDHMKKIKTISFIHSFIHSFIRHFIVCLKTTKTSNYSFLVLSLSTFPSLFHPCSKLNSQHLFHESSHHTAGNLVSNPTYCFHGLYAYLFSVFTYLFPLFSLFWQKWRGRLLLFLTDPYTFIWSV